MFLQLLGDLLLLLLWGPVWAILWPDQWGLGEDVDGSGPKRGAEAGNRSEWGGGHPASRWPFRDHVWEPLAWAAAEVSTPLWAVSRPLRRLELHPAV